MFTLADLTKITGAKRRSVQLWSEAGALQADPQTERAGAGTHRAFGDNEVIIACVLHAFALQGVPIGKLLNISRALRSQSLRQAGQRKMFKSAINGDGLNILFFDQRDITIWSSLHSKHPLDATMKWGSSISGIYANLNTALAGATQALRQWF